MAPYFDTQMMRLAVSASRPGKPPRQDRRAQQTSAVTASRGLRSAAAVLPVGELRAAAGG